MQDSFGLSHVGIGFVCAHGRGHIRLHGLHLQQRIAPHGIGAAGNIKGLFDPADIQSIVSLQLSEGVVGETAVRIKGDEQVRECSANSLRGGEAHAWSDLHLEASVACRDRCIRVLHHDRCGRQSDDGPRSHEGFVAGDLGHHRQLRVIIHTTSICPDLTILFADQLPEWPFSGLTVQVPQGVINSAGCHGV